MLHEPIALDVNHMMSDVIGFQYGIDPCQVDGMKDAASCCGAALSALSLIHI